MTSRSSLRLPILAGIGKTVPSDVGLHGLLLPLRGQAVGFSTASLGLLGTAWAVGFFAGCILAPRLVRQIEGPRAALAIVDRLAGGQQART